MAVAETPAGLQVRASPRLFGHFVLGVTPHTTQASFLECRAPVKVAACGRRWGKSTAVALDVLHLAVVGDGEGRELAEAPLPHVWMTPEEVQALRADIDAQVERDNRAQAEREERARRDELDRQWRRSQARTLGALRAERDRQQEGS